MILDGKAVAARIKEGLRSRLGEAARRLGRPPRLALVNLSSETAARTYFEHQRAACEDIGIAAEAFRVEPGRGDVGLAERLSALSRDEGVDAILIEMPLPQEFSSRSALAHLAPEKDVEGLAPVNQGRLYGSKSFEEVVRSGAFVPCTALAILRLLRETRRSVAGARAVVIGRSGIVGRPAAHLLSCLDATVTLAHSQTRDLGSLTADADILVAAAGKPGMVTGPMVKEGAVVLDAGTTWEGGALRGDVDFESVLPRAAWITPVPGGVGPVTVAELLNAVVVAAERRLQKAPDS
jgi:methylenetetrahydrofolate dehydrogenase (NADP+)/methenyltetrahydrofolate cyclohydrolase